MPTETWRDIPGYEGCYQASDLGRVRSVDRRVRAVSKTGLEFTRPVKGVVLRPGNCRGYLIVNLVPGGTIAVHLLVARTFLPPQPAGTEVNHCDGVKRNCALSNLEWMTKRENQLHAVSTGLRRQAMPVTAPSGKSYPSIAQAARGEGVGQKTAAGWAT